jgi:cobalt-zinc-cadmium efflux system membrane fusion protein
VIAKDDSGAVVRVDHPDQFSLVGAGEYKAARTLNVTGSVNPDVSRQIPVISLANGRVVAIHTRLGDTVQQGQLLLEVQSNDIAQAFDQYWKAVNDERLARVQFERAQILYQEGAIAKSQLEIAEDSEQDAKADLNASQQQLTVLGVDRDHPSLTVKIYAPATGVITAQNVTEAAPAGVNLAGSATAFTITDMAHVWVICDVYENDLAELHLGQTAGIHLSAYPGAELTGMVSDIGAILDPTIRTAKVRIQVENPRRDLRLGMFVTATLKSRTENTFASVPATAILHLHDRDWVYVPSAGGNFRRLAVDAGDMLPGNQQQILSGVAPGQQVVSQVLQLETALEAQ